MTNEHNDKFQCIDMPELAREIKQWSKALGFQQTGISNIDLTDSQSQLLDWLAKGHHGEMDYMSRHGEKRWRPELLVEGTCSIISVRMDYLPPNDIDPLQLLEQSDKAYISRYALGRDYHKVLRNRLQKLAKRIEEYLGPFGLRVFVDSAPVLEKPIAAKAGLGWIGKHSNLLSRNAGSWFFLGEIYVDLLLPADKASENHCGRCTACLDECPTDAIISPYIVDSRRCISYLTIELHGAIPVEFRKAMGNRIYGCDDCQLVCPWNRFSSTTQETDFHIRHQLNDVKLVELFLWEEQTFLKKTEGSPIRRIGYERWLRNIAVALGNAESTSQVINALQLRANHSSSLVREHVQWALEQHQCND